MTGANGAALRIGWLGAGRMGVEMAGRLLRAGHDLAVYNRSREKAAPLAALGATVVDSPAELAGRDVVFSVVANPAAFDEVTLGAEGLLRSAAAPRMLVDSSTVSAEVSARVRDAAAGRGCALLAAPVSGNPKAARAGRLTFAVSGPADAFEEVAPLLAQIGRSVTYVGAGETARLVKLCHNVFLGVITQSLAEVTVLAEKGGVGRAAFLEFLNDSVLGSVFTRYKTPAFVNLDLTPTFTMELLRKDLDLGMAAARELEAPLPLAALTHQLVQAAVAAGYRDLDFAGLLREAARSAGLSLEPEDVPVSDGLTPVVS